MVFQISLLAPPAKMRKRDSCPESTQTTCSENSLPGEKSIVWPPFLYRGRTHPTEFEAGSWKCPICSKVTPKIRQHLTSHEDLTTDEMDDAETYCTEMAKLKRIESKRKADVKRANDPKRKETLRKADVKRADDPKRREALRKDGKRADAKRAGDPKRREALRKDGKKADAKRADDPMRREALRKADVKRADDPHRKETMRKARRKYAQTQYGKFAKHLAQEKYLEKLGEMRRKAQYRKYQQTKLDKARGGDDVARRIKFQKAVLRGPEYVCSCCHRSLYRKSVTSVTEKLREKIKMASEEKVQKATEVKSKAGDINSFLDGKASDHSFSSLERQISNKSFQERTPQERTSKLKKKSKKMFSFEADAFKAWNHYLLTSVDDITYLCSTCKSSLQKGNIPAMAVANALQLGHHDRPILTELENNLISHTINFQKIVLLPKSRMAAGKGRMISIPVGPADIMNTVKQLPRLPNEAGLVPIKLKRKKEYKTHEKHERIRPEQIFLALRYLRKAGNPFYQFYDEKETYLARCRIKDQRGLRLMEDVKDDIEEDLGKPPSPDMVEVEDQAAGDSDADEEGEDEMEIAVAQEEEDIQNDPVRRHHFNYNEFSALVNGHPDIFLDSEGNQMANLDFAPGEGKKPTSFLDQKHWDIKSWPTLLPDGKFGISHERKVKLTKQNYFQQRLLNVDDRFAKTPGYLFGAMSVVEAERLRSNANLTGMKGKRNVGPGGHVTYQLEDPCTVFEKIPGTPKYWQRAKYEIIAKLENIGPFQVNK